MIFIALGIGLVSTAGADETAADLARQHLIVDTHIDVPYRLNNTWADVTAATEDGDFDYPRAVTGGLNIPFMSIYTPAESEAAGTSHQLANLQIDGVEALVARAPDQFVIVRNPVEARAAMKAGKMGLAMGMENGSPVAGELANVAFFRERGISYITLAHSLANHISDSSYDKERPNEGLSDFGRDVIREMNRTGVMVDVSHVSDAAFWQVLEISAVPVIASHSSARHFTPDFERNMSDEMIKALAANGGVIMINYGSSFLTSEANLWFKAYAASRESWLDEHGFDEDGKEAELFGEDYRAEHPFPFAGMDEVMAHYQHVIDLVGVDHVGIGSDYDGVGDSLPAGLKDVSSYPNLVQAFLDREYPEGDIAKILGGNLMRVWAEVVANAE